MGAHDPALPVFIDPLLQATYLGGGGYDFGLALAIHPTTGEIYLGGSTHYHRLSWDFRRGTPANGAEFYADAFVGRLSANLTTLLQATYLGENGYDLGNALAIHPTTGEIYPRLRIRESAVIPACS